LPYRRVPPMKPVVELPPVPAKFAPQVKEKKIREYRHQAPVEKEVDIEEVVDKTMAEKVSISYSELMALSPKYRNACKDRLTKKRIA
ncbi:hypothetical protein P691DRAFT_623724, partial [Macrolepiota fuliginosa MF-IS2]